MKLKEVTFEIAGQLMLVLNAIGNEKYAEKISLLSGSSIGQHVRHVIECFNCFMDGYETGIVNYDNRKRELEIEINELVALSKLQQIQDQLKYIDLNKRLIMEVGFDRMLTDKTQLHTTAGRELAYNIEHAIHHMALIKIGLLNICPKFILPESFGVAYSTINHKNKICVQ